MKALLLKIAAVLLVAGMGFWSGSTLWSPTAGVSKPDPALPPAASVTKPVPVTRLANLTEYLRGFDPGRPTRGFHAGLSALGSLEPALILDWWSQLMADESLANQKSGIACLAAHWVETDPAAARHLVQEHPAADGSKVLMQRLISKTVADDPSSPDAATPPAVSQLHDAWLRGIASTLTPWDPAAAWMWARGLNDAGLQKEATLKVLRRLALLDPARTAGYCREARMHDKALLGSIMENWLRTDAPGAWAWVQSLDAKEQNEVINGSLASLGKSDAAEAIARLEKMPQIEGLRKKIDSLAKDLASRNPAAAADLLLRHAQIDGAFGSHNHAIGEIITQWLAEDGPAALAWLKRSGNVGFGAAVEGSRAIFHQFGPEAALDFYFHAKSRKIEAALDTNLFNVWATADPEGLMKVLQSEPRLADESSGIALDIARELAGKDAAKGIAALIALSKTGVPWGQINSLAQYARAEAMPGIAKELSKLIAEQQSPSSPDGDASLTPPRNAREQAITADCLATVAKGYAQNAPSQAAVWADRLPDGPGRDAARTAVAAAWSDLDPIGASEWLVTLPATPARDAAVAELVKKIAPFDPERAAQWNATIQEQKLRQK